MLGSYVVAGAKWVQVALSIGCQTGSRVDRFDASDSGNVFLEVSLNPGLEGECA